MVLLVRLRTWLARHPAAVWWAVVASAATAAWGAVGAVQRLDAERRAWGESLTVWVADHDIAPGETITARTQQHPRALIAAGAVRRDPAGAIALQHLTEGEVVSSADVGRSTLELLPSGWRGVTIAITDSMPGLEVGGGVDVVAAGQLLVDDAVVIALAELAVTVGVPRELAPAVADAIRLGEATVVLRAD